MADAGMMELLALADKIVDLTTQLALTNQSLTGIAKEVQTHNKILYGDETGKGGLLTTIVKISERIDFYELSSKEKEQDTKEELKRYDKIIANMNRVVFGIAATLVVLLIGLGFVGWKEAQAIVSGAAVIVP